jgi:hypothetical protein
MAGGHPANGARVALLVVALISATAALGVPRAVRAASPDFALSLAGAPVFNPGTSATITATVTPLGGETSPVTLVADQSLVQATPPVAAAVAPYGSTTFTLTAHAVVAAGTYTFGVDGTDASGISHRATTTYTLTASPATFSLSASPSTLTLQPGQTAATTVAISAANGMSADILLSSTIGADSAGTGTRPLTTWSGLLPATRVPPPYAAQTLTVTVPPNTEIGTYHYDVIGASDDSSPVSAFADLYVVVTTSPDFTVTAAPGPTFNPGTSATLSVSVSPVNGESSPIVLSPEPGVATFSPPSMVLQPPYGTVSFAISANASIPPGTYAQAFTAADDHGFWHRAGTTFTLTAAPAGFTVAASPASLTIPTGGSASVAVTVLPQNGMTAPVILAAAPGTDTAAAVVPVATWANGAGALGIATAPYPAQPLLFTVAPNTAPGGYHFVVRGASDDSSPATATADIAVTVVAGAPLPSPRAQGSLSFLGTASLSTFPCAPPPPFGSGPCNGSFSGDWGGHLSGLSGGSPYAVTWQTTTHNAVQASFQFYEVQCLGGVETVLGVASGSGSATALPGAVQGKYQVVGETVPRDVTAVSATFAFHWTRAGNTAALSLAPMTVSIDVAGLGTRTVVSQPQNGVASLVVTSASNLGAPTCATPLNNVQGVIGGVVPLADTGS